MRIFLITFVLLSFCRQIFSQTADVIYQNGDVLTMEDSQPNARAIAAKDGKILAVGSAKEVKKYQGKSTELIDLKGKTLLPGFIDAHSHFSLAMALTEQADLSSPPVGSIKSLAELIEKLKSNQQKFNIQKGQWILGWGYDPDQLSEKRHPNKFDLDAVFPDNPVFLMHVSGHMAVVNSRALEIAKINADTPNPNGGVIVRLPNSNEPSGLLQEMAGYAMLRLLPVATAEKMSNWLEVIQKHYAGHGITTASDGNGTFPQFEFLRKSAESGKLKIDIEFLANSQNLNDFLKTYKDDFGKYKNRLRLSGVKAVIDGSPQGKTAFFTKPYLTEVPGCTGDCKGYPNLTQERLNEIVKTCYSNNIQLFTHGNGDASIDYLLASHKEITEQLSLQNKDLRTVIIHSQFVRKDQLEEYQKFKMIPSFFSNHAYFWGDVHSKNLGEDRASFLSPHKTALKMGITATNHTDFIVTPINQLFLTWTATNRLTRTGKILGKDERLPALEALKTITINAAYQYRQEATKGSLKAGKLADFVILDKNPLKVKIETIKDIQVLETIKEGKTFFRK